MRISRKKRPDKPLIPRYNKNEFITAPEVRVLDLEGNHVGVMKIAEAVKLARDQELDLVEINPKGVPPVAQLIDFVKFKYQKEKEARKMKSNAHVSETKGIRLSVNIGEHDMEIRKNQSIDFLNRGDKVKMEIILRGRENARPDIAFQVLRNFFIMVNSAVEVKYEQDLAKQGNKVTGIIVKK